MSINPYETDTAKANDMLSTRFATFGEALLNTRKPNKRANDIDAALATAWQQGKVAGYQECRREQDFAASQVPVEAPVPDEDELKPYSMFNKHRDMPIADE